MSMHPIGHQILYIYIYICFNKIVGIKVSRTYFLTIYIYMHTYKHLFILATFISFISTKYYCNSFNTINKIKLHCLNLDQHIVIILPNTMDIGSPIHLVWLHLRNNAMK